MLLYVIRHGDPIYYSDSLTPKGRKQAEAVAKRLAVHGLDRVFSSPRGRARMTAEPTCELLGLTGEIEPFMDEDLAMERFGMDAPDGSRQWIKDVLREEMYRPENDLPRSCWYEAPVFAGLPVREGYEAMVAESDAFMRKLGLAREGGVYRRIGPDAGRVACFCHAGFGCAWLSHLLWQPPQFFWRAFGINHTGVTIINFEGADVCAPKCICLSDNGHMYAEGLPLCNLNRLKI